MTTDEKIQIVCGECGSSDVTRDACGRWDSSIQEWELSATYDQGWCEICSEARLEEVPLEQWGRDRLKETPCIGGWQIPNGYTILPIWNDDETMWHGSVKEDGVTVWTSDTLYHCPEEAKDGARRAVISQSLDEQP